MGKSWNSGDIHKMAFYAAMYTKEAAGGRFFSPRVDSRQRHHKGSSHQPQVGGCFLFGYDSWESNRAAPANFLSVCPAALDKSPPSAL